MRLASLFRHRRLHQVLGLGLSAAALTGLVHLESVWAHPDEPDLDAMEAMDELDEDFDDEDALAPAPRVAMAPTASTPAPSVAPLTPMVAVDVVTEAASVEAASAEAASAEAAAAEAAAAEAAAAEAAAAEVPPVAVLVAVPDIEGMSVRKARKALKEVGLKIAVRDSYNDRIPREEWSFYKVRRQKVEAGTEVEPGARIRVKARPRFRATAGY